MQNLGLDIKVLLAQIINFALLLIILKKFLYGPLVKMIDERNKKISTALDDSKKIEETLRNIEKKETEILSKAKQKAKNERAEMVALADVEKEGILKEAKELAKQEVEKGLESIKIAENEAVKILSDQFMKEVVASLQAKLTKEAKTEKYPLLKKIIQQ